MSINKTGFVQLNTTTEQNEEKIAIEIQKATKDGESTERLLAAEIIHYRRAWRSHTDLAGKMIEKY